MRATCEHKHNEYQRQVTAVKDQSQNINAHYTLSPKTCKTQQTKVVTSTRAFTNPSPTVFENSHHLTTTSQEFHPAVNLFHPHSTQV
jgi:hypothetical protein